VEGDSSILAISQSLGEASSSTGDVARRLDAWWSSSKKSKPETVTDKAVVDLAALCSLAYSEKLPSCNGLRSVSQLSDDDSTRITKLEERKGKTGKMASALR
jgi:hypothetical protein